MENEIHIGYVSLLVSSMKSHKDLNIFKLSSTIKCLNSFRIYLHVIFSELEIVWTFFNMIEC